MLFYVSKKLIVCVTNDRHCLVSWLSVGGVGILYRWEVSLSLLFVGR